MRMGRALETDMQLVIKQVCTAVDADAVRYLEDRVFRQEKKVSLAPLEAASGQRAFHLLARAALSGEPVATLSVVETPPDSPFFRRYRISIPNRSACVARFTRLAVLPEYRGQSLSMRLILEAQRRLVAPAKIQHTWLLFDAARASKSLLCTLLGFHCGSSVVRSEYGPCRVLFRDELSIMAHEGNRRGWAYLAALADSSSVAETGSLGSPAFRVAGGEGATAVPPAA